MRSMFPVLAVVSALVALPFAVPAQDLRADVERLDADDLKHLYLVCDHTVMHIRISPALFAACSVVGSVLLEREFGGDLERQLAWWRQARIGFVPPGQALPPDEGARLRSRGH